MAGVKGREDGMARTGNESGFALFEICMIMIMVLACIFPFACAEHQIYKCSYSTSNFSQNFHHKIRLFIFPLYIRLNVLSRIMAWSHTPCTSGKRCRRKDLYLFVCSVFAGAQAGLCLSLRVCT